MHNYISIALYLLQKLNSRLAVVKRSDLPEKDKIKWMSIINVDFMSSEESMQCSGDDQSEEVPLLTKILPWRAQKVTKFFKVLDGFNEKEKSAQSKKQTKKRIISDIESERSIPIKSPSWALVKT